ncbi:MAG: SAM-dependent methyltransferase [Robiginitomaculum sp.]|nr:MAG: SAM-dependent methyltransferase [Robiginitomaculum sp.]
MKLRLVFAGIAVAGMLAACGHSGHGKEMRAAPDMSVQIAAAIAATDRPEADVKRDEARRPAPMLEFSTIQTGDVVADLGAGGGYFSRLLSTLVGPDGTVLVQNPPIWLEKYGKFFKPGLKKLRADRTNITFLTVGIDDLQFEVNSLDAVTMMLIYHDVVLLPADRVAMNAQIYAALKSDGVLLITDHHAVDGSGEAAADPLHRIDANMVLAEVEAAGFVLDAQSDALHFADDDHTINVFQPEIRGKTDRFVYRFRKAK